MDNENYEYYVATVRPHGNGARINVPKRFIGQTVKVILEEPVRHKKTKVTEDEYEQLTHDLYRCYENLGVGYRSAKLLAKKSCERLNIISYDDMMTIVTNSSELDNIKALLSLIVEIV